MSTTPSQTTWNERIDRVASYINENIGDIDCTEEVASAIDVSYETLRKRFRREMGVPIGQYLRQKRMDEARRLLLETDEPVYVVCRKVGYSSDSNGIRAFRRCTGMTMEEYRQRYGDEPD
jgi:two-component system response regulator YesN